VVVAVAVGVVCASLGVPRAVGSNYELQVMLGQASSHDTPAAVELVRQVGIDLLGTEHVHAPKLGMGAKDFGCFVALAREGGTMFGLGVWSGEGDKR
jgi:hypothetical protein